MANAKKDPLVTLVALELPDFTVLREALWHAVQRGDVPDAERERMHSLYDRFSRNAEDMVRSAHLSESRDD